MVLDYIPFSPPVMLCFHPLCFASLSNVFFSLDFPILHCVGYSYPLAHWLSAFFSWCAWVIKAMMTVSGVISRPTGRCCAKGCIPGEFVKLGVEHRAPTGSHRCCVFHPHLFFLFLPMEPEAWKWDRQLWGEWERAEKGFTIPSMFGRSENTAVRWGWDGAVCLEGLPLGGHLF